jgi:GNAT superfamily N-acetyltransferase
MRPVYYGTEKRLKLEFNKLLETYFAAENLDHVPLSMDWQLYQTLEDTKALFTFTARDGRDALIGAVMYVVMMHPHHAGHRTANCDIICVNPENRGQGIGRGLMSYAEPRLKALGVSEITHQHKLTYKVPPLFLSQGYEAVETVYRKKVS